jgi:hypothetical protein
MIGRRNGRGLLGRAAQTAARTALVAGVATAVSSKVAGRHNANAAEPAAEPTPAALSAEAMDQLKKLAELHTAGILTEEEFAAQKARILG